jgi:diaminohydroxyphosphoribosylaminopyrimidine deaminase/5-amino-6-(5-phosphoribosylamino)uracil reductase
MSRRVPGSNGSLLREGCVDELLLYVAPSLLGEATGLFDPPPATLDERTRLRFVDIERIGEDLRVRARVGREPDASQAGATALAGTP